MDNQDKQKLYSKMVYLYPKASVVTLNAKISSIKKQRLFNVQNLQEPYAACKKPTLNIKYRLKLKG